MQFILLKANIEIILKKIFLRFWEAVQELKTLPQRVVEAKVEEIWNEYLGPEASCPINVDSKSFEVTKKNIEKPDRWSFDVAAVSNLHNFFLKKFY